MVCYQFDDCVIDPATRTIRRGGDVLTPERKVFDLLLLLVSQRTRVVTKAELLRSVWGSHVVVTDGVVARTIMKARRSIGDDANDPRIIKTIHRVGYRFVAPVEESANRRSGGDATASPSIPLASARRRIAIMPFKDRTGRREMAWFDLGLMSATNAALSASGHVTVVPAAEILAVAEGRTSTDGGADTGTALLEAVGASGLVQATVTADVADELRIHFIGQGGDLDGLAGELSGFDAIDLCQHLARTVVARLAGVPPDKATGMPRLSRDRQYIEQIRARAADAMYRERWELGRKLLRAALDFAPEDLTLRLDHASCLVWQRDPGVSDMLEVLLREARLAADSRAELRALHLHAMFQRNEGHYARAEELLTDALRIAEDLGDRDAELELLVTTVESLAGSGQSAVAGWMLDRAAQLARTQGNLVAMARLLDMRGRLAWYRGDRTAIAAFEEAVRLGEHHGLFATAAFALVHLGRCLLDEGRMAAAAASFQRAFDHACKSGSPVPIGISGVNAVRYAMLQARGAAELDGIVARMREFGRSTPTATGFADVAQAAVWAREGRLDDSAALCEGVLQQVPHSLTLTVAAVNLLYRVLLCQDRLAHVGALAERLDTLGTGRARRAIHINALHCRALLASRMGRVSEALQRLQDDMTESAGTLEGANAALDAAWLLLDADQIAPAASVLANHKRLLLAALRDDYEPAVLVLARLHASEGRVARAARLLRRHQRQRALDPGTPSPGEDDVTSEAAFVARCLRRAAAVPTLSEISPP